VPYGLRRFLIALLAVYVAKQLVVAFVSPPFTGHDEVAHFAMIRIVATEHRMPTLWADTLPADLYRYRAFAIEWRDRDHSPLYTAVHPPLYYVAMAPVYLAASHLSPEGIQYVLRCASIPCGVALIVFASLLTTTLFPRDAFLGVTVPTAVAFQPQVSYEAAMVNNDALAIALYTGILLLMVLTIRDGATIRRAALLGIATGVALLAKGTTAMALVLMPMAPSAAGAGGAQRSTSASPTPRRWRSSGRGGGSRSAPTAIRWPLRRSPPPRATSRATTRRFCASCSAAGSWSIAGWRRGASSGGS